MVAVESLDKNSTKAQRFVKIPTTKVFSRPGGQEANTF